MNRLGLGINNFRIIGSNPTPEFERYIVSDCVIDGDYYNTIEYEPGTFEVNDRVTFTIDGRNSFGKIYDTTTEVGDDINPSPVGVNSANCFNNYLNFSSTIDKVGTNYTISFYCNPNENFVYNGDIDSYLVYSFYLNIYYEGEDGEGNPVSDIFSISGLSNEISGYEFIQNENNFVFQFTEDLGDTINYIEIIDGEEQPSFGGTIAYSDNNGCNYSYFSQNEGQYTFNAGFRTEC